MTDQGFYSFRETGKRIYQSFALELVPGDHCQLKCRNCYKRNGPLPRDNQQDNMPKQFVLNSLSQACEAGFSEAVFIGGEPTLHPDLPDFIHRCLAIGLSPIVCTNGIRLADPAYADKITQKGVTIVIHAPLPAEVHNTHVQIPGYAAKLNMAYKNILGRDNVNIVSEVVAIQPFLPHIPDVYSWALENGITPFVEINRRWDTGMQFPETANPEEVQALFQELASRNGMSGPLLPPAFGNPCTMSITGLHVKNFGAGDYSGVYSCCAQKVRHGDLRQQTVVEVLDDPTLEVFKNQDEWIYGPCRECKHYSICRGGCRGEAFLAFGCPRASSPACWHISPQHRQDRQVMAPPTCAGCPLQGNTTCLGR